MAYSQQTWVDGSAGGTPVNAARLNHMEAGIAAATGTGGATISDGGTWTTGTAYTPGQTVTKSGVRYECAVAHTAGTFATDLSAGKWVTLGVDPSSATTLPTDAAGWLHDDGAGVLAWTTPTATQVGADASGAASTAQAFAVQRANHTGTQSADTLTDGTTNKAYTATEKTKLAGIATGATANVVGAAGSGASNALSANDPTTTNARTPTAHTHPASDLTATGTRDATTFLRGDNTWATPAGGGGSVTVQDEGSALTVRSTIDFVGAGVTATDDAANSRTVVTIPGGGASSGSQFRAVLPTGSVPGVFVESLPRYSGSATGLALTSGSPRLSAVTLRAGEVVTSMTFVNGGTSLAGATHQWAALADLSGNVLAVSADDTGAANWALSAPKTFTMSSAYTVPTSGVYYAVLCVVATTPPTPMAISGNANLLTILTPYVAATSVTNTGPPPAVAASLGALTAYTSTGYVAIA